MKKNQFIFLLVLLLAGNISAQDKEVHVKWIDQEIELDGALNESVWSQVDPAKDFWQYFPTDTVLSTSQTEIKMLYDAKYLYVGIIVFAEGDDYIVPSLRRDFSARANDNISLLFDTYRDGSNAFLFGSNPEGVQRDALISGGGADFSNFRSTWDVKWENVSKVHKDHYIAEMKIPLSSFKFRDKETVWRFNSYRFDTQSNEWSSWANIPQNQNITNLAFMGLMIFEKPLRCGAYFRPRSDVR